MFQTSTQNVNYLKTIQLNSYFQIEKSNVKKELSKPQDKILVNFKTIELSMQAVKATKAIGA